MTAPGLDLFNLGPAQEMFRENPFGLLNMLRENQPLLSLPGDMYAVSRYADLTRLIREIPGGFRSADGSPRVLPAAEEGAELDPNDFMLLRDGAPHTRLRKLVSKAFTPRMVDGLRPEMEAVSEACIDGVLERGELDVARDIARVVPSTIICLMLGVPVEDRELFTDWTANLTHSLAVQFAPEESMERAGPAFESLHAYFVDLIAERRKKLGDDLISELIRAEEEGDRLSESELMTHCIGLLVAGFETTIGLIGLGTRQLLLHPDELTRLREDPGLITTAVEECLRYDPPIIATMRVVHEDVEWHGQSVPKDSRIIGMIAAANRDPRVYDDPERFDIGRTGPAHWSFGGGEHLCLGAHLARLEAQVAIGTLVRRLDGLELEGTIEWSDSVFRVPSSLPVHFTR
jgi:cytochrome P450